jgi:hypothetical protein
VISLSAAEEDDAEQGRSERPAEHSPDEGRDSEGFEHRETGARGQGFGLSSGGGGSAGHLEISNFCCPDYLASMLAMIKSNWSNQQNAAGSTHLRFVIQKDGRIVDITVEKSSGVETLDFFARRALLLTSRPSCACGAGAGRTPLFRLHPMTQKAQTQKAQMTQKAQSMLLALVAATVLVSGQQPSTPPSQPQQQTSVELRLSGDPGTPPRMAVPDLLALSNDKETQEAARMIAEVLWDDLNFERGST